jgi:hypothetical protein
MAEVPPYYAAHMPKKNNTLLIVLIILGALGLCCCGVGGYSLYWAKNNVMGATSCIINIEVVRDATMDYVKAHDGVFPKAETWQDDIRPYLKKELTNVSSHSQDPFHMFISPNAQSWPCDTTKGKETGLAYNSDLSGKKLSGVKDPETTVLIFETPTPKANDSQPYKKLNDATAPKAFGTVRGWATIPIEGGPLISGQRTRVRSGGSGFQVSTNND